jgi:chondroitin AC lyase
MLRGLGGKIPTPGHSLLVLAVVVGFLLLAAGASSAAATTTGATPLLRLSERLLSSLLESGAGDCRDVRHCTSGHRAAPVAARRDAAAMAAAGSWPDVNYTDRIRTGSWSPHLHLERMVNLAAVVRAANDSALIEPTLRAIGFWLKTNPRSDNWWWNELEVPARIADTALLFRPWLEVPRQQHTLEIMVKFMERAVYAHRTGDNLDNEVATAIKRGVLLRNQTLVATGFGRLWHEIRIVQPSGCLAPPRGTQGCATDGIQADSSFHQHGPELLDGSYGEGYAQDTLGFMALAQGTIFAPSEAQVALFTSLLLDGMRWMTVGSPAVWDWSVKGRDVGSTARPVAINASLLCSALGGSGGGGGSSRQVELSAFASAINGSGRENLDGHRSFWTSDYSVIHSQSATPDRVPWMASIHMHSNRTVSARCVNGQGSMNEHTGDGMVYTYSDGGDDYDGALHGWDWRRLPGITADVDSPMLPCNYSAQLLFDSEHMNATGTVSDGTSGMAAMLLISHGASAKKALAMLPQGLVHLVADARGSASGGDAASGEIVTTFENKVARGPVHLSCGGRTQLVPLGTLRQPYSGCQSAWHNGTGYVLPEAGISVLVTHGREASANNATKPLFSLAVSHTHPHPLAAVSLTAVPGMQDAAGSATLRANVTIAANDGGCQAVWSADSARPQLMAVIWRAGVRHQLNLTSVQALGLTAIESDRPCVLLIRQSSSCGSFTVTASDPTNDPAGGVLSVQLSGITGASVCSVPPCPCSTAGEVTTVHITLPGGFYAGQSANSTCIPHVQSVGAGNGGGALKSDDSDSGYLCKNVTADWPLPCSRRAAAAAQQYYPFAGSFPINAWWGPIGYAESAEHADPRPSEEFLAYAAAGFNMLMVSDRGGDHCDNTNASTDWNASWAAIQRDIALGWEHNMTSLIDTYRCIPWGPPALNGGGDAEGATNRFLSSVSDLNHVITLPEVQWLAPQLARLQGAAGLLITDDGVTLARNELEEIAWMVEHTPTLFPWVNSCGDGAEWLARAGTPFAVVEQYTDTYGAKPPSGGNGTALAERLAGAQLAGFDVWGGKALRFGLVNWPMIGDVSPTSAGQLNSSSMLRIQAYGAVAFGAKGIFWYSWGQALWQFEPHAPGPTAIYPVVAEVNARLGGQGEGVQEGGAGWAAEILQHDEWQAVFATGWWGFQSKAAGQQQQQQTRTMQEMGTPSCTPTLPEFVAQPHAPKVGLLVEAMADELLIGVMTSSAPSTLLLIVDKRVSDTFDAPARRCISVRLSSAATAGGGRPRILGGGDSATTASFEAATNTLTATGLRGGDAIALVLPGTTAATAARALRRWRFDTGRPSLTSVWTDTHQSIHSPLVFSVQRRRATPFLLGGLGLTASGSDVARLAQEGAMNLLTARPAEKLHEVLNAGMRQGVAVLAMLAANESAAVGIAAVQASAGCHPNWAGFVLHDGKNVDPRADGPALGRLAQAQAVIRQGSPHAFALVCAGSAEAVLRVSNTTGLPMVALSLPPVSTGCQSVAECAVQMVKELVKLRDALSAAVAAAAEAGGGGKEPAATSFLVVSDPCASGGEAGARLQGFTSLLLGVGGLFHRSDQACTSLATVFSVNDRAAQWASLLHPSAAQLVALLIAPAQPLTGLASAWPVPSGVHRLEPGSAKGSLVTVLGPELVIGVFQAVDRTGLPNASLSPPMLMVLDTRTAGNARRTNLTLSAGVV